MFKEIREVLDKYEEIICSNDPDKNITDEDYEFVKNIELYLAIAIRTEFPDYMSETLGKVLCDMAG